MRYSVTIGDRSVQVDLSGPEPLVDGTPVKAELRTIPGTLRRHLLVDAESHPLVARRIDGRGCWHISIGGRTLEAEALDERTRAIREMSGAVEAETAKLVAAPMPGLVVRINVELGQEVAAGQGVIVVEAMKMENELKAPTDGVISRIEVAPGQAVEKGATLIVLE